MMIGGLDGPPVRFFVAGLARPKGSKRAFALKRKGEGYTGRVALVESAGDNLKAWERDVRLRAYEAMGGRALIEGPVRMTCRFWLPKPKSAPKTRRVYAVKKPDLSKLIRAVEDCLTGIVFRDDSQIIGLACLKDYGDRPGVEMTVEGISDFATPDGGQPPHEMRLNAFPGMIGALPTPKAGGGAKGGPPGARRRRGKPYLSHES